MIYIQIWVIVTVYFCDKCFMCLLKPLHKYSIVIPHYSLEHLCLWSHFHLNYSRLLCSSQIFPSHYWSLFLLQPCSPLEGCQTITTEPQCKLLVRERSRGWDTTGPWGWRGWRGTRQPRVQWWTPNSGQKDQEKHGGPGIKKHVCLKTLMDFFLCLP